MTQKRILFHPDEYRDLTDEECELLAQGYERAIDTVRRNITPLGFSACSVADNEVSGTDVNYRSVWARDGAITTTWTLGLEDEQIRLCQAATLRTLLEHQSPTGQIPASVSIDTQTPEYSGVGGIASIDSGLWVIIALYRYADHTGDWSLIDEHRGSIQKCMDWLGAHDSNNCGLLEIPEAGDWTDLFGRSYHVLYDEVLWYRALVCHALMLRHYDETTMADDYQRWADHVREILLANFWPVTQSTSGTSDTPRAAYKFTQTQFSLGDARYLVAQITPFSFSWRCDVYANVLAYLTDVVDRRQAMMTFAFLWGSGANDPAPVKNLYPPVQAGDPDWRDYYTVNLLNLPEHYHNGGIWPFIGGMWVRYLHKLDLPKLARREMVKLANLCRMGASQKWEFNEWHHGRTGRAMGKAFQAWSAASYIQAAHDLHVDPASLRHDT
jgi:glycogen debranching enzyme